MKTATIPYPREFQEGNAGLDCQAVKRILKRWAVQYSDPKYKPGAGIDSTKHFGAVAGKTLAEFKHRHGLLADPVYTLQAHERLRPFFDERAASAMAKAANSLAAQRLRDDYVKAWRWAIAHHGEYDYREVRPIPEGLAPFETTERIETDCSGNTEIMAVWTPGCPDPSHLGFNSEGNTGSILHSCARVTLAQALPGDLALWRRGSWDGFGHHVAALLERVSATQFKIGSHGHQGDPNEYLLSDMTASQTAEGYPDLVLLRFLPVPTLVFT